ncbi:MAG: hypothetical protein KDK90_18245 [Leptospiraceae bacterium]|nr:hypothetical protein [Leptospiraceae bacterium]
MELKAFKINNKQDVKKFLHYLKNDAKLDYNPGDDFRNYFQIIKKSPKFTKVEAKVLNRISKKCYQTCHKKKIDIDSFSLKISLKELASQLEKGLKEESLKEKFGSNRTS